MARSQAGGGRRVDWFAAGLGLVLAVVIRLVGETLLFSHHRGQVVSQGLLIFGALLAGGFLAGLIGPVGGATWNGIIVAVGFIVVAELAAAIGPVGPLGSAGLDTLGLVIDDVLVLSGGTIGGLAAGLVRRRTRIIEKAVRGCRWKTDRSRHSVRGSSKTSAVYSSARRRKSNSA